MSLIDMDKLDTFPVVGIGASAGGLEAVSEFLENLPPKTGMAFVVIQHLSPDYKSMMVELLAKHTKMVVVMATNNTKVKPNHVYCIPPKRNITINNRTLSLTEKDNNEILSLPIDLFFNSLGNDLEENSVGIVLSGTGSDGSRGLKMIREAGGMVMAQTPASAKFDGMPQTAIGTGLVDYVLDPTELATELVKYFRANKLKAHDPQEKIDNQNEKLFNQILLVIKNYSGVDFTAYKRQTLFRRLEKCMSIKQSKSLQEYFEYLGDNPEEIKLLYKEFLIGVTEFFRDPDAFESLKQNVIPQFFKNPNSNEEIRIWVVACSTGEEVYSLAILIDEYITQLGLTQTFKIFATDIDQEAIDFASRGIYKEHVISEISPERLKKYFTRDRENFQVIKALRQKIVFARHNAISDPPFIRMNLVTCRNFLIYIQSQVQKKLLINFQFALSTGGFLMLGSSETIGDGTRGFEKVDSKWRIYKNEAHHTRISPFVGVGASGLTPPSSTAKYSEFFTKKDNSEYFIDDLLDTFVPDCVYITSNFEVLYFGGSVQRYFHFPSKRRQMSQSLLDMVNKSLQAVIRNGTRKVKDNDGPIKFQGIQIPVNKNIITIDLQFDLPQLDSIKDVIRLTFTEVKEAGKVKAISEQVYSSDDDDNRIESLENELQIAKEELQITIEKLETANEELQAANEELLAANEELQSTNEELQSVNEELYSVNTELQIKNKELQDAGNDMNNLLNSTEIATIFLDRQLRIRKFTPLIKDHFNIERTDIGRPIGHFSSNIVFENLTKTAQKVIDTFHAVEQEITNNNGDSFILNITPFKTENNQVEGVVITFLDITSLKKAQDDIQKSEEKFRALFETTKDTIVLVNEDGQIENINKYPSGFTKTGKSLDNNFENILQPSMAPEYKRQFELLKKSTVSLDFSVKVVDDDGKPRHFENEFFKIKTSAKVQQYYLVVRDITELTNAQNSLEYSHQLFNTFMEKTPVKAWIKNDKAKYEFINKYYQSITKLTHDDVIGRTDKQIFNQKHEKVEKSDKLVLDQNEIVSEVVTLSDIEGGRSFIHFKFPLIGTNGKTWIGGVGVDITKQIKNEERAIELNSILKKRNEQLYQFTNIASHNLRSPISNITSLLDLLGNSNKQENLGLFIKELKKSSNALLNTVNTLGYVMTVKNQRDLPFDENNLEETLNNILSNLSDRIEKAKATITYKIDEIPTVYFPKVYLESILMNLISNSLKYCSQERKPKIVIKSFIKSERIMISVKDNGIGIDMNKHGDKLFHLHQTFHHLPDSHGEGLFISRTQAQVVGGDITVESKIDQGSTFTLEIPNIKK